MSQNTRLRGTLARIRQDDARKGKGVSREAQDIFDAMSKTLPTKWEGENIVVLDVVVIAKPYRSENCKAGKGVHPQMLTRVRKVVSGSPLLYITRFRLTNCTPAFVDTLLL